LDALVVFFIANVEKVKSILIDNKKLPDNNLEIISSYQEIEKIFNEKLKKQ
jgi:hypothetical protein